MGGRPAVKIPVTPSTCPLQMMVQKKLPGWCKDCPPSLELSELVGRRQDAAAVPSFQLQESPRPWVYGWPGSNGAVLSLWGWGWWGHLRRGSWWPGPSCSVEEMGLSPKKPQDIWSIHWAPTCRHSHTHTWRNIRRIILKEWNTISLKPKATLPYCCKNCLLDTAVHVRWGLLLLWIGSLKNMN